MPNRQDIPLSYKILIMIEDRGEVASADILPLGPMRQVIGSLGRLEGLGYIERIKREGQDLFQLTDIGDAILDTTLSYLPKNTHTWDEHWHLILFDIPEAHRSMRQLFRLKLMDLGARILHASIWITPYRAIVDRFNVVLSDMKIPKNVTLHTFEVTSSDITPEEVEKLWQLHSLSRDYKAFFTQLEKEIKTFRPSAETTFRAKCLIYRLAQLCKRDPRLPASMMPPQWIGFQASNWYEKLRKWCQT